TTELGGLPGIGIPGRFPQRLEPGGGSVLFLVRGGLPGGPRPCPLHHRLLLADRRRARDRLCGDSGHPYEHLPPPSSTCRELSRYVPRRERCPPVTFASLPRPSRGLQQAEMGGAAES